MNRSYPLAAGAILTALCWLLLAAVGVLPTGRFFLLTLASLLIVTARQEIGFQGAVLVYLAASLLALLWPGPVTAALFALCLGIQPLILLFLRERTGLLLARLLTHLALSLLFLLVVYLLGMDRLVRGGLGLSDLLITGLGLLALQLFLLVYYYTLRAYEIFYRERLAPWIRRRN